MSEYFIDWDSFFEIGIKNIDDENEEIIKYTNELYELILSNRKIYSINDIFEKIYIGIINHISKEEEIMFLLDYPSYDQHTENHEKIISKLEEVKSEFDTGNESALINVINFISECYLKHLLEYDKQFSKYYTKLNNN